MKQLQVNEICKPRNVKSCGIDTPLIVPSFSSTVISNIAIVHERLKDQISNASLVSAYDIKNGHLNEKEIWCSDVVFIDSGNFERRELENRRNFPGWTVSDYGSTIVGLKPVTEYVIVNYDEEGPVDLQIDNAMKFFGNYTDCGHDFLCKPEKGTSLLNGQKLIENLTQVTAFDILGFTEKEIGKSILERCENILRIRIGLDKLNSEMPIHIFGCVDPFSVLLYFLCGADIFDGLNWLKDGYNDDLAIYQNNYSMLNTLWEQTDDSARSKTLALNLSKLGQTQVSMKQFARKHDINLLGNRDIPGNKDIIRRRIAEIAAAAGIEI